MAELLLPAKSTAEFRAQASRCGGTRAHSVHELKRGVEAVLGSRWRLQTAEPACSLPASCLQPWDRASSSLLLGWAPSCPQPLLVGEDAGGPGRNSRNFFKKSLKIHLSVDKR